MIVDNLFALALAHEPYSYPFGLAIHRRPTIVGVSLLRSTSHFTLSSQGSLRVESLSRTIK
jgi:hypothetical protein